MGDILDLKKNSGKYAFISYSSKNQLKADSMRQLLKQNKILCWMAPYDIPAGSKYAHVINDALENCACLVLLLSNESQNSQFVGKEVERAITYRKPIVTMQLEDMILNSGFKFYLGDGQIVAVHEIDSDTEEMRKIINGIRGFTDEFSKLPADKDFVIYNHWLETYRGKQTELVIPSGVYSINPNAFYENESIKKVMIPRGVTFLEWRTFFNCRNLEWVDFPEGMSVIEGEVFSECAKLSNVVLPESIDYIGKFAFAHCCSLKKIKIPKNVANIKDGAFMHCTELVDFEVDAESNFYTTVDNHLYDLFETKLIAVPGNVINVNISPNTEYIGNYAYAYCEGLFDITIPGHVKKIGEGAFEHCTNLKKVIIEKGVAAVEHNAFNGCVNLISIEIPSTVNTIGQFVFNGCENILIRAPKGSFAVQYAQEKGIDYQVFEESRR